MTNERGVTLEIVVEATVAACACNLQVGNGQAQAHAHCRAPQWFLHHQEPRCGECLHPRTDMLALQRCQASKVRPDSAKMVANAIQLRIFQQLCCPSDQHPRGCHWRVEDVEGRSCCIGTGRWVAARTCAPPNTSVSPKNSSRRKREAPSTCMS